MDELFEYVRLDGFTIGFFGGFVFGVFTYHLIHKANIKVFKEMIKTYPKVSEPQTSLDQQVPNPRKIDNDCK